MLSAQPASLQVHAASAVPVSAAPVPLANMGLLAFSIAAHSRDGMKQFNIALHPADLGSIQIQMSVDPTGATQLHMQAENPQTLQLLRQDAPQLQSALKDAGINLAGGGLNFSLQGQQQQNPGGSLPRPMPNPMLSAVPSLDTQTASTGHYMLTSGSGRLDIKV